MATLPTPITGREAISDPREPLTALAEFYRAFNAGDLALMAQNWDSAGDVVMDNPLGGIMRGWPAIREVYVCIFDGPARVSVALHEATLQHHGEVFVAIGRERGELVRGGERFDLAIRTSRVYHAYRSSGCPSYTRPNSGVRSPGARRGRSASCSGSR